jgi:hypothetical protein
MALAAEAAKLSEIFPWLTDEQSKEITHNAKEIARIPQEDRGCVTNSAELR